MELRMRLGTLLLLLTAPVLLAGQAVEEPPQKAEVKLPEGVEPLGEAMQGKIEGLREAAEKHRGLKFKSKTLAVGQKEREALKKTVLKMFEDEMPKEVMTPYERSLKRFDLIPQEMDLATYYPELLTSQIGGYYDPKLKYLVLVKMEGSVLGPEMEKKMGKAVAERMDETILVHEITHAIQDQHYNLEKFGHDALLSDAAAAKLALIEGDATHVMYGYMLGVPMERFPGVDLSLDTFLDDPAGFVAMMPEMPGAKEIAEAPAYLRENLLFSYMQGLLFVIELRKAGGQKLLDHAFAKDPPKSTEQILHPEKWIAERDDPIEVKLPDLTEVLPGYRQMQAGNWGEFNVRLLLDEHLGKGNRAVSKAAAAGWGGDAFALFEKDGKEVLVWLTAWDSPEDADEFHRTAGKALTKGWRTAKSADGLPRVALVRGEVDEALFGAIREKLMAVELTRPKAAAPDFAALGITDDDKPQMLSAMDMQKLLADPVVSKIMQMSLGGGADGEGVDIAKLMENPKVQEMAKKMAENMGADGDAMAELLKNPAMQKMIAEMFKPTDVGEGKTEEGVWTNEKLGIRASLPKAEGWSIDAEPQQPPMGQALVELKGPDDVKVAVVTQKLPMAMPLRQVAPMTEGMMGTQIQDYQRIRGEFVKKDGREAYDMEFTGSMLGDKIHVIQRMFIEGAQMLVISANVSTEAWEKHGAAIKEAVESLGFVEAKAAPPKKEAPPKEDDVLKE